MKIVFCGGGTGGHIYPALALAEAVKSIQVDVDILFIGTKYGLESKVVPECQYLFETIAARGFQRKLSLSTLRAIFSLLLGTIVSLKILIKFKPDVVVGTGGYASVPVVLAAWLLRKPVLIQEQNVYPGAGNRLLARFAKIVVISFDESKKYFPLKKRLELEGNPIREDITKGEMTEAIKKFNINPQKLTLAVFGGSRGAHQINKAMIEAYRYLREEDRIQVIHLTGDEDYSFVKIEIERIKNPEDRLSYKILPYLKEMEHLYAAADLVISRAGAITLAEITACGLPAILIPYPYATRGHQKKNAEFIEKRGAAFSILDKNLNGQTLAERIKKTIFDKELLSQMSKNSKSLAHPEAAKKIADLIAFLAL